MFVWTDLVGMEGMAWWDGQRTRLLASSGLDEMEKGSFRFSECEVTVGRGRTRDENTFTVIEIRWTDTEKEGKRNGE